MPRHSAVPQKSSARPHRGPQEKLTIEGKYVDRGETLFDGYVDSEDNNHLAHVNFP